MFYTLLSDTNHTVFSDFETLFEAMCNFYYELNGIDLRSRTGVESIEYGFLNADDETQVMHRHSLCD